LTQSVADIEASADESGIDVVNDGEFGKSIIWAQYVRERLSGFERRPIERVEDRQARARPEADPRRHQP
jgi:5-methyltetrahydropteroyltriglutamate--homocysteine methyltransferase